MILFLFFDHNWRGDFFGLTFRDFKSKYEEKREKKRKLQVKMIKIMIKIINK